MGVVVSEITIETTMATARVTENSRKRRPTIPPIISRGMNTAISDTLMEITVKPTSSAPRERGVQRVHPLFKITSDIFHHHDRIVHDETGGDRQRHERKVVDAVPAKIHDAERADQRHRNHDAGNQGGAQTSAERRIRPGSPERTGR